MEDLRRLIGQDVGLQWVMPMALDHLRETAPDEAVTGWYDDDLLSAVFTRKEPVWRNSPTWAGHLNETIGILTDLSPYIQSEADSFHTTLADLL